MSKLSPEQREKINKRLSYIEENNLFDVYLINDLKSLLSSEHAWREEVLRIKGVNQHLEIEYAEERAAHNAHATELLQKEQQLNQALKVLRSVTKNLTKPTTDKCECETCLNVKYIDHFLSSLSRKEGKK